MIVWTVELERQANRYAEFNEFEWISKGGTDKAR